MSDTPQDPRFRVFKSDEWEEVPLIIPHRSVKNCKGGLDYVWTCPKCAGDSTGGHGLNTCTQKDCDKCVLLDSASYNRLHGLESLFDPYGRPR